jgi:hypothetical protein
MYLPYGSRILLQSIYKGRNLVQGSVLYVLRPNSPRSYPFMYSYSCFHTAMAELKSCQQSQVYLLPGPLQKICQILLQRQGAGMTYVNTNPCMRMFIAALVIKFGIHSNILQQGEWSIPVWSIHAMECYSAIIRNHTQQFR